MINNWDMIIKHVDNSSKEYYTPNKLYEVRNGKVIVDKDYKNADKTFTLEEFLSKWQGVWTITRVKINNNWYQLENKERLATMDRETLIKECLSLICLSEGIGLNETEKILSIEKDLKEDYTTPELKKCYKINSVVNTLKNL